MKVVIMQPSYLPWLGYFDLMNRCNLFVVYDDVKYTKNDWRNRNKIKTSQGEQWVTVPIEAEGVKKNINMVQTDGGSWANDHIKAFQMNYAKAPFFDELFPIFKDRLEKEMDMDLSKRSRLIDISLDLIYWIKAYLGIKCDITYSSAIGFNNYHKTERLVLICETLGATEYISPNGSKPYLVPEAFEEAGIKLTWQDYSHPTYDQQWGEFKPNMSIIDLLFNKGKESAIII